MFDRWLMLLEREGGPTGGALIRFFRALPTLRLETTAAPGALAQGGYLWRFGRPTLRLGLAALHGARAEMGQRGISEAVAERLIAGIIGHEIRHLQRRELAGCLLGEVDAWAITFELYQAMGVAEVVDGQGWSDAAFHGHRLRAASPAEIWCSPFARQRYPAMPLYPGWRGWLHRTWSGGRGDYP
jgi:hypothetical protein